MKKSSVIAIVLFLCWNNLFCQYDQKYWNYRERFRKYFTVVGSGQGESNVLVIRNGKQDAVEAGSTEIRVGNQMMNLGDYIAMLAMEYKILSEAGQNTNQTAQELYYALYAFNRIDYIAETHFNLSSSLNGFFIRDDVYSGTGFVASHSQLNNGLSAPSCSTCYVDYIPGSGEVQGVDHTVGKVTNSSFKFPSKCNESSSDDTKGLAIPN